MSDANCSPRSPGFTRRTRLTSSTAEATSPIPSGSIRTGPSGVPPANFEGRRTRASLAWAIRPLSHTAQCMDKIFGQRAGGQPARLKPEPTTRWAKACGGAQIDARTGPALGLALQWP